VTSVRLDSVVRRNPGISTAPLVDELVMLDLERGAYYGLDEIATYIWSQIDEPRNVADLCKHLLQVFDVDRPTCERDVLELLEWLHDKGLVYSDEGPPPA
jgi:hypothetical protein